jgi:biopolymer transport protein ExbD
MAASDDDTGAVMSQINVTPLVDVLLVLLLVLMVSASAAVSRALDVSLPSAAAGVAEASTLTLRVSAEGRWWMDDQPLDAAGLKRRLQSLGSPEQLSVVIAADGSARHEHVIAIMDVLRSERVTRLAFAVQPRDAAR